jgi:superfamily I DNA/RNA helicase
MNLSKLQQEIINDDNDVIFVEAAAASGKTALIIDKIKKELNESNETIVAFTFTNAAAEEMSERLGNYDSSRVFIGTIHSYCVKLLLSHGITKALEYCEEEWFDQLFQLLKEHLECIKPIGCIICDEMQDCNEHQFEFIFEILNAKKYFCCYDKRQSIYRWRGAHPEYIDRYADEKDAVILSLNENYRNAQKILTFAKNIIATLGYDYLDTSIAMRVEEGYVSPSFEYKPLAVAKTFSQMSEGFGNWFILTRTNAQLDEIAEALKKYNVPFDTFKRAELSNKELNRKMKENTVKVLTIHSAKGLEADNVIVIGAKFFNLEEKCISYVAATRARNKLYWAKSAKQTGLMKKNTTNWEIL